MKKRKSEKGREMKRRGKVFKWLKTRENTEKSKTSRDRIGKKVIEYKPYHIKRSSSTK